MANPVSTSIILTVSYSNQFEYPLTVRELYTRLIWVQPDVVAPRVFAQHLVSLISAGRLGYAQGFIFLPGNQKHVATRIQRQQYAQQQRDELWGLIVFLQRIPWMRGIVITGSLALQAITKTDDSDFLLIVAPKRLWLTRILVIFFAWMHGKRRSWHREEENSWCFNLWLDTNHLALPKPQRSVYSAYEVLQADWVWSSGATQQHFYLRNRWVRNYLPHYWSVQVPPVLAARHIAQGSVPLVSQLLDLFDFLAYHLQLWYMKPHRTREKVGRGLAFFHPRDTQSLVNQRWQAGILTAYEQT